MAMNDGRRRGRTALGAASALCALALAVASPSSAWAWSVMGEGGGGGDSSAGASWEGGSGLSQMSMLGAEGQMGADILHFSQPRLRQEVAATASRSGVQFVQAAQWASMLAMVAAPIIAVASLAGGGGGGGGGGGDALIAAVTGGAASPTNAPVPEPASIAIFALSGALLGLALVQRRRSRCTEST